ncbi:MAG: FimB/Mfa2 family fimbrial subunit [Muribaculaceae bacterium]|nr:FimB/Mfa2 family fimbrial subunit [Muribaculaceae bacterium]
MKLHKIIIPAIALVMLSSCSMLHDDLEPCRQKVNINLCYTKNMQSIDQFNDKVHCAKVLLYDSDGNFYGQYDYDNVGKLSVVLPPGNYHTIAYGGMACDESDFDFNISLNDAHHYSSLETYIKGTRATESSKDLHDHFHAVGDFTVRAVDTGEVNTTLDLTKNTNRFRVELMYEDGSKISASNFNCYITADNAVTDHSNAVVAQGEDITYRPYQTGAGQTDEDADGHKAWMAWADITTGRLTEDSAIGLHVDRAAYPDVFIDIPLIEYLEHVRQKELGNMSLQEYLDRQDHWTLTFTIQPDIDQFTIVSLKINNWNMVLNDYDF